MLSLIILAASLTWFPCATSNEAAKANYKWDEKRMEFTTNLMLRKKAVRLKMKKQKPVDELTPVEAWHKFCRPDGKVEIPQDKRPEPYKKVKPNPHERKPRK